MHPNTATCRDALAMLRKQYGFEASPKKRKQKLREGNEEDGLALEQVTAGCYATNVLLVNSHVK